MPYALDRQNGTDAENGKDLTEKQKDEELKLIFDSYLKCLTQEEIVDKLAKELNVEITQGRIAQIIKDDISFANFCEINIDI